MGANSAFAANISKEGIFASRINYATATDAFIDKGSLLIVIPCLGFGYEHGFPVSDRLSGTTNGRLLAGSYNAKAPELIHLQGFATRGGRRSQRTLLVLKTVRKLQ